MTRVQIMPFDVVIRYNEWDASADEDSGYEIIDIDCESVLPPELQKMLEDYARAQFVPSFLDPMEDYE